MRDGCLMLSFKAWVGNWISRIKAWLVQTNKSLIFGTLGAQGVEDGKQVGHAHSAVVTSA